MQHGIQDKPQTYQSYTSLKAGRDWWRAVAIVFIACFLGSLFVILALLGYIGNM